jgi:hypothetical protein
VGPRAGLDRRGKSRPHQVWIPGTSIPQRIAISNALSRPQIILSRGEKLYTKYNIVSDICSILRYAAEIWTPREVIKDAWEVSKCGAGEGGRR